VDALSPRYGEDEDMAYYNNITGVVRGKWYRIPEPSPNSILPPEIPHEDEIAFPRIISAPMEWGNSTYHDMITGHSGKFVLDLSELHQNSTIQFVEATLNVGKDNGDNMFETKLQGVHFPGTGEVVLVSTTPRKYFLVLLR
jgi:hypothetical protein